MKTHILLVSLLLAGCGDTFTLPPPPDAGDDAPDVVVPSCTPGQTFCPADGGYSQCGNIARYRDDCTIEYGCCLGGTPVCRDGQCLDWSLIDAQTDASAE